MVAKLVPKIKQSAEQLLPSRLFSDGLFTFDGKSVTVATSILALLVDFFCIVAVPDRWILILFGILVNLATILLVNRPRSCGFSLLYVLNWASLIIALLCALIIIPFYAFMEDETMMTSFREYPGIFSSRPSNEEKEKMEEMFRASLPGIRLVMIGMAYIYVVLTYISVAAMRHIRRSAEQMLLPQ